MPIYHPISTQSLHFKLGYVGSGTMSPGSTTLLTIDGGSIQGTLSQADKGTQVSVIFAGPSLPFVPRYPEYPPGTFYPGSLLVAKIAQVVDGNTAYLDKAASNDTLPNSNNVTVYREVSTDINSPIKVQWTLTTSSRGTLSATIFDPHGSLNVFAGMPVYLYDDVYGDYFGGAIDTVKARNIPGKIPGANPIYWDIQAVAWSSVLERRIINPYYPPFNDPLTGTSSDGSGTVPPSGWHGPPAPATPANWPTPITGGVGGNSGVYQPGQFTNMYLGDIVNQIIFGYCDSEGLSSNSANGVGPLINFYQANPGKDTIAQAIDNAAQAGFTADQSWFWWIDPWKQVFLVPSQTFYAPWNVDESGASGPNDTDASVLLAVSVETTREKLANRVYIDSSQTIGATRTDTFYTDRSKHSYSMSQPLGGAPTIWIGHSGAVWTQSVAVKGAPKQSANWYWALGDNSLEQDTYTTLAKNCGGEGANTLYVVSAMLVNWDNLPVTDMRCMLQIEQEYVRLRSGSMTTTWTVDRGATVIRLGNSFTADAVGHAAGSAITPAGMDDGNRETFNCTYQPMTKQTFWSTNSGLVATQAGIESGTGFWDTQISLGAPFYDPYNSQGQKLADGFVQDYGVPPRTFEAETYRPGLAIGQIIYINLVRPPVKENFLIDQVDFTAENKRQKWSFRGINGALIGDWRKAFLGLSDQFAVLAGAGSNLAGSPGSKGVGVWTPGAAPPLTGDPLSGEASFTLLQDYFPYEGGAMAPQLTVSGLQQFDGTGQGIPVKFQVRREYIGGAVGSEGILDAQNPSLIQLPVDPSTPLTANAFAGRILSLLANGYADNSPLPLRSFTIVSNDALGNFTCTPAPYTAGCRSGDVFLIRTGRAAGTAATAWDAVSTPTTFTDPLWKSSYNGPGLINGGNVGNIVLVIAGTGAGQERQLVTNNTYDTITVSPGWSTQPDATSCIVVVDNATQTYTPALATRAQQDFTGFFSIPNYSGNTIRVEGYLTPYGVEEGAIETVPYREMYVWGAQGTRVVDVNTTEPMRKLDGLILFDTSGVATTTNSLAAAVADEVVTAITLTAVYAPVNGTQIQVESERMLVTAGAGTTDLTVIRGWGGTVAAAHTSGVGVTIPGELRWTLIPYSQVPNQTFKFQKAWWGNDISYVRIIPASDTTPNELPDGEPYHILADASVAYGSYDLTIPDFT